jgi:UDP-N-acetylglucosamine 1-carboxyvinyltransferase
MSAFLTQCKGESLFEETIYENRLRHIPYLNTMGANIQSLEKKAVIIGASQLRGRKVKATDLRAGASLLVAGMLATGTTEVSNVEHLLRGYENVVDKLNNVGADIKLIDD